MLSPRQRARLARDGIFNVRDLGGLATTGGRAVARRRVLRADSLHRIRTSADVLVDLGLVRVLDLRDERERVDGVLELEGVEVLHHPVIDPAFAWFDETAADDPRVLALRYRQILSDSSERFAAAVEAVAETLDARPDGAVAYHCAVGKDRTGLLTALLLGALEVSDDAIVGDYARSAAVTAVQVSWLWAMGHPHGKATEDDIFVGVWSARPETMHDTLRFIREEFGGAAAYLEQAGVPRDALDALRAALLVESDEEEHAHARER